MAGTLCEDPCRRQGLAGCKPVGVALVGGETAEMPDLYAAGDDDFAGVCVGVLEADAVVDGRGVRPGDALIGARETTIPLSDLPTACAGDDRAGWARRLRRNPPNARNLRRSRR